MFDTVIVPLDGSRHAEAALPVAIDEAKRHEANLVLLHVIPRPEPCQRSVRRSGPSPWQAEWPFHGITDAKRTALTYLNDVAGRYQLGPRTAQRVVVGLPGYQIDQEARRYARPLIVLTTGDHTSVDWQRSHVVDYLLAVGHTPILGIRNPARVDGSEAQLATDIPPPCPDLVEEDRVASIQFR